MWLLGPRTFQLRQTASRETFMAAYPLQAVQGFGNCPWLSCGCLGLGHCHSPHSPSAAAQAGLTDCLTLEPRFSFITCHAVMCRGGLPPTFFVPELAQFEARNTTLREPGQNSRGENLPEWWV